MEQFLSHQARHEDRLNEHDNRITRLETKDTKRTGYIAGISAAVCGVAAGVAWLVTNFGSFFK